MMPGMIAKHADLCSPHQQSLRKAIQVLKIRSHLNALFPAQQGSCNKEVPQLRNDVQIAFYKNKWLIIVSILKIIFNSSVNISVHMYMYLMYMYLWSTAFPKHQFIFSSLHIQHIHDSVENKVGTLSFSLVPSGFM